MCLTAMNQRAFLASVNIYVQTISPVLRTQILGHCREKRHGKLKFFQGLPYNGPVYTRTVITLSFGVRFGPTRNQTARGERPENTPRLQQEARSTLKFSLKQDFLALKVKEHHLLLIFRKVSKPIDTPLERNPRDYGQYKH